MYICSHGKYLISDEHNFDNCIVCVSHAVLLALAHLIKIMRVPPVAGMVSGIESPHFYTGTIERNPV